MTAAAYQARIPAQAQIEHAGVKLVSHYFYNAASVGGDIDERWPAYVEVVELRTAVGDVDLTDWIVDENAELTAAIEAATLAAAERGEV